MKSTRLFKVVAMLLSVLLLLSRMASAQPISGTTVIYVTATGSAGSGCGTTWSDPCSLEAALSQAIAGDEVWVTGGLYAPGAPDDVDAAFLVPPDVALYGGFAGTEVTRAQRDWLAHPTILSGDLGGDDRNFDLNSIA
jgi:hypothetical protein